MLWDYIQHDTFGFLLSESPLPKGSSLRFLWFPQSYLPLKVTPFSRGHRENRRQAQKEASIQQPSIFLDVLEVVEQKNNIPHMMLFLMVIYHGRK